jgi:hypothetical protein
MKNEQIPEISSEEIRPAYEKPEIKVMSESELLVAFQVTQAAVTWWVM